MSIIVYRSRHLTQLTAVLLYRWLEHRGKEHLLISPVLSLRNVRNTRARGEARKRKRTGVRAREMTESRV